MPTTTNRPLTFLEEFLAIYELDRERSTRRRPNHRPITLAASAALSKANIARDVVLNRLRRAA